MSAIVNMMYRIPFSFFRKENPSAIPANGELAVRCCTCSGIAIKNNSTQNANTKLAKSISRTSERPPIAKRKAASIGLNTTIRLFENEFIPLTLEIFSFGTNHPVATADAGCWKAFVTPTIVLTI